MDVVSFETAKKLEKAGFKNPHIENELYVAYVGPNAICSFTDRHVSGSSIEFFAPFATDILEQLGSRYSLQKTETGWFCDAVDYDYKITHASKIVRSFGPNDNPAEVCAEAWLDKNTSK